MAITPPNDIDTERQLLGALLVRSKLIPEIDSEIKTDDFYLESHRIIYTSILEQNRSGIDNLDAVQVIQRLTDLKRLEEAGGANYIMALAQDVLAPGNASHHAHRLKSISTRRKLMQVANLIVDEASQPVEDEISFLRNVEERVLNVTNQSLDAGIVSTYELKREFQDHVQNLLETKGNLSGLATHFRDLDQLTSGLKGGELIVIAARPGEGKTTLALNVASNISQIEKQAVLLYSLEMSHMELMIRLLCSKTQIFHDQLKRGQLTGEKEKRIQKGIDEICNAPLYIDDTGAITIWECVARSRKFQIDLEQQGKKLGLVIIDYLQLMSDPDARRMGRQQEVATISRCLKQLARTLNVPVIAVSQLNRGIEQRRGASARPQLSDLRESGAIEQDADMVLFIYNDMKAKDNEEDTDNKEYLEKSGTIEMILAKHRNGPTGNFRLTFRPQCNQFETTSIQADSL